MSGRAVRPSVSRSGDLMASAPPLWERPRRAWGSISGTHRFANLFTVLGARVRSNRGKWEGRERIAKELHDGVFQALFAVGMGLEGTSMVATDPQVSERINVAVEELDHVIRDLRNYIFGLRPGIIADRQLDTALRALGDEFQGKTGAVTIVEIDPEIAARLASVASDVVQLTREALSNVGRHARATTCRVSLRHEPAPPCWRSMTMAPASSRPPSAAARVSPTSRIVSQPWAARRR
jgi:signal transduction histidine kinase